WTCATTGRRWPCFGGDPFRRERSERSLRSRRNDADGFFPHTMTDADAFLAAIVADPDADGPRLAYADWLGERGDAARAEFLRVQCELAKIDENHRDIHPSSVRER